MENVPRGSDGRRLFTPEFKREQVARLVRGELTLTELSRELGIARSMLQRWKHLIAQGGETAVAANGDVVPASELRAAQQKIREQRRRIHVGLNKGEAKNALARGDFFNRLGELRDRTYENQRHRASGSRFSRASSRDEWRNRV